MSTSRLKSRRRQDQGSKLARTIIGILATIGVIDTGSITFKKWGWISSLSCPGGTQGCDKVLDSPWGTIFEVNNSAVPLSLVGLISYILILLLAIIPFLPLLTTKKLDSSRTGWWCLFFLSTGMTIFSFLLMGIMIFRIEAFCFFCVLSTIISSIILILTVLGGGWEERRDLIIKGFAVAIIIFLGGLIWSSSVDPNKENLSANGENIPPLIINQSSPDSIKLAKYLNEQEIRLYNAYWCPHCHDQKEMFGREAASHLIAIECAADGKDSQTELCQSKGITGFPSWEINGEIISGVRSLNELADLSGYKGSRNF